MNRKPTSIIDFLKTVSACTHPLLKDGHRIVLGVIAQCADWKTGAGSRPTYELLEGARGITRRREGQRENRQVGNILRDCKDYGLIEQTHRGGRRKEDA